MAKWWKFEAENADVVDSTGHPIIGIISHSVAASGGAYMGMTSSKGFIVHNIPQSNRIWVAYASHFDGMIVVYILLNDIFVKIGSIFYKKTGSWGVDNQAIAGSDYLSVPVSATLKFVPDRDVDLDYFLFSSETKSEPTIPLTKKWQKDGALYIPSQSQDTLRYVMPNIAEGKNKEKPDILYQYYEKGINRTISHKHNYQELTIFIRGKATYEVADKRFFIKCGVMFSNKNQEHTIQIDGSEECEFYDIGFNLSNIIENTPQNINFFWCFMQSCLTIPLTEDVINELMRYVAPLYVSARVSDNTLDNLYEQKFLLSLILINVKKLVLEKEHLRKIVKEQYIIEVMNYISQNLNKNFTTNDVAGLFYVSRAKLLHDFKLYTGLTLNEFITATRMKNARDYLLIGESIRDTAEKCGYPDICYFIRVFKKYNFVTPYKYIQMNRLSKTDESSDP